MSRRPAITFDDEVTAKLQQLGKKSPACLDSVLYGISFSMKQAVLKKMDSTFTERTGQMKKGIQYQKMRKAFFKLRAPALASIYEHHGADITGKGGALRFKVDGEVVYRQSVHIEPRPFFYPGVRGYLASGELNRVAEKEIDHQLKKVGLKL